MSNSELLACPKCQGNDQTVNGCSTPTGASWAVDCVCGIQGPRAGSSTGAIAAWNTRTQLDELRAALFEPIGSDVSYNLQGVLHDLEHQFNPNDGGVCARTVRGAIEQIEIARKALGGTNPEMEKLMRDAAFSASEHKYDPDTSHE